MASRRTSSRALVRRARRYHSNNQLAWRIAKHVGGRIVRNISTNNGRNLNKLGKALLRRRIRSALKNTKSKPKKQYESIVGRATGTTHTTSRLITRRTPKQQRALRKYFKTRPVKVKYVNRFGFSWMGANQASKTIWYSICHLKWNNVIKYMNDRLATGTQPVTTLTTSQANTNNSSNTAENFIYIGKCTFQYELYNPTNYIITVYVYDLICKRDTPFPITYSNSENDSSCAPENLMQRGAEPIESYGFDSTAAGGEWRVADQTIESSTTNHNVYWNTIGMKPTDYHYFNTFWKVKGMKKIILPPGASHHHTVVYNPKTKVSLASLYYPHQNWSLLHSLQGAPESAKGKFGMAGLTQATLFGFQGQVAIEDKQKVDSTAEVGTLPGKIVVNCIKKINVWNIPWVSSKVISEMDLKNDWTKPMIYTDLVPTQANAGNYVVPS